MSARPILAGFAAQDPLVWRGAHAMDAASVVAAARQLATALEPCSHVMNLCESPQCFLVASIAAWIAGRSLVLPPGRLARTLEDLRAHYPRNLCVSDTGSDDPGCIAVQPVIDGLAMGSAAVSADAWPALDDGHPAAILFTSGTTGTPQPHVKTWGELVDGADALRRSIAAPERGAAIVGTVPAQHMFGFETTVMLPLQSGTPVVNSRPQFAADLADVLQKGSGFTSAPWLITTPLQLRAFHRERNALRGIARIVVSTMPLDPRVAADVERDWKVPVHEIFGCTEAGMLAVRRPALATAWTPAAGVRFDIGDEGRSYASGGHLRTALPLVDRLHPDGNNGTFELVGRDSDIVKIAGKRASLGGLAAELLAIPGVIDAAVFLPHDDATRVAALVVAPGIDIEQLRLKLAQRVDAAFLPRPLVLTASLPRSEIGKLPLAALRKALGTAQLASSSQARRLVEHATFARDHPVFAGHFPGHPIVPGVLLLELVQSLLARAGLSVAECSQAKFLCPVGPDELLSVRVEIDHTAHVEFGIASGSRTVALGNMRCVQRAPQA